MLGRGPAPTAADIGRAVQLVERGVWCWLVALVLWVVLHA
jgi:cobalamin biosynthesis protein CobD/CbiB